MKTSIFIDGNNFYFGLRKVFGNDKNLSNFNFEKFCNFLIKDNELASIFYYNAALDASQDKEKHKKQQRFFDNISRIPKFNLILCSLLKRWNKETGKYYYVLKEDDIHMAVDLVLGACDDLYDEAIVVSGDGDFVPAVLTAQKKNKKISNACFKKTASTNLKKNCDELIKLNENVLEEFFDED